MWALIENVELIIPFDGIRRAFQHRRLQSGFPCVKAFCIHGSTKCSILGYMTLCFSWITGKSTMKLYRAKNRCSKTHSSSTSSEKWMSHNNFQTCQPSIVMCTFSTFKCATLILCNAIFFIRTLCASTLNVSQRDFCCQLKLRAIFFFFLEKT